MTQLNPEFQTHLVTRFDTPFAFEKKWEPKAVVQTIEKTDTSTVDSFAVSIEKPTQFVVMFQ